MLPGQTAETAEANEKKENTVFQKRQIGIAGITAFELLDGDLTWDMISSQYDISRRTIGNYRKTAIRDIDENLIL